MLVVDDKASRLEGNFDDISESQRTRKVFKQNICACVAGGHNFPSIQALVQNTERLKEPRL